MRKDSQHDLPLVLLLLLMHAPCSFSVDGITVLMFFVVARAVVQIQIMGLCEHLNTPVKIEYLDGQDFTGQLGSITLPDTGNDAMVTLLYR